MWCLLSCKVAIMISCGTCGWHPYLLLLFSLPLLQWMMPNWNITQIIIKINNLNFCLFRDCCLVIPVIAGFNVFSESYSQSLLIKTTKWLKQISINWIYAEECQYKIFWFLLIMYLLKGFMPAHSNQFQNLQSLRSLLCQTFIEEWWKQHGRYIYLLLKLHSHQRRGFLSELCGSLKVLIFLSNEWMMCGFMWCFKI